jgi:hypothetical protein
MREELKIILGSNYGIDFFTSVDAYGEKLEREGILVFPKFINEIGISHILNEAEKVKDQAYQSRSEYNVYVKPNDPNFNKDSARNRIMHTTKKCIPNDLISNHSPLIQLYNSPLIRIFFASLFKVPKLYPYSDPLSSININYYGEGDALGWHFDNSDFTITLLIKNCNQGGIYQYFTDMRYTDDGDENYQVVEDVLNGLRSPKTAYSNAGDLMLFKGNRSLHKVTEVEEGERILVTLNYNIKSGVPLSKQSRLTFFGRSE